MTDTTTTPAKAAKTPKETPAVDQAAIDAAEQAKLEADAAQQQEPSPEQRAAAAAEQPSAEESAPTEASAIPSTDGLPSGTDEAYWTPIADAAARAVNNGIEQGSITASQVLYLAVTTALSKEDAQELVDALGNVADIVAAWSSALNAKLAA